MAAFYGVTSDITGDTWCQWCQEELADKDDEVCCAEWDCESMACVRCWDHWKQCVECDLVFCERADHGREGPGDGEWRCSGCFKQEEREMMEEEERAARDPVVYAKRARAALWKIRLQLADRANQDNYHNLLGDFVKEADLWLFNNEAVVRQNRGEGWSVDEKKKAGATMLANM